MKKKLLLYCLFLSLNAQVHGERRSLISPQQTFAHLSQCLSPCCNLNITLTIVECHHKSNLQCKMPFLYPFLWGWRVGSYGLALLPTDVIIITLGLNVKWPNVTLMWNMRLKAADTVILPFLLTYTLCDVSSFQTVFFFKCRHCFYLN